MQTEGLLNGFLDYRELMALDRDVCTLGSERNSVIALFVTDWRNKKIEGTDRSFGSKSTRRGNSKYNMK